MVAAGDAEFFVRPVRPGSPQHYIWDHVPGVAIVPAAGGIVSDLDGEPLGFSHGRVLAKYGVIVSNPRTYPRVLEAVKRVRA